MKKKSSFWCFIPFQWSKLQKEIELISTCCCLVRKTWRKKIPTQKWNLMMKTKHKYCAWRDTLYLLHSWKIFSWNQFHGKNSFSWNLIYSRTVLLLSTQQNVFWSHETSHGLKSHRHFFKTVDLSALLNTDAYKNCVFLKNYNVIILSIEILQGKIKLYHDMRCEIWNVFFWWGIL